MYSRDIAETVSGLLKEIWLFHNTLERTQRKQSISFVQYLPARSTNGCQVSRSQMCNEKLADRLLANACCPLMGYI